MLPQVTPMSPTCNQHKNAIFWEYSTSYHKQPLFIILDIWLLVVTCYEQVKYCTSS